MSRPRHAVHRRIPALRTAPWRVFGASVPGASHLRAGLPCQDAHRYDYEEATDALLLAVADGAGSRERSAEGAVLAVGMAVDVLREALLRAAMPDDGPSWLQFLHYATDTIHDRFLRIASQVAGIAHDDDADSLATTLTVAVVRLPWVGLISVGDGFVVARTNRSELHLLLQPSADREAPNQTTFLTSPDSRERAQIAYAWEPELTGVALATDGLASATLDFDRDRPAAPLRPHRQYFDPLFKRVAGDEHGWGGIARHLLSDGMHATTQDDLTILLAVREALP
jgi:hypothetical protein